MSDLSKIKPVNNYVLIKPDTDMAKSNARTFRMDTSFDQAGHAPRTGVVVAVPDELEFDRDNTQGLPWETLMELEVGDEVTYHYLSALTAEDKHMPRFFEYNGEKYYFIKYDRIYTAKRISLDQEGLMEEIVICLNGFVLVEPVQDATLKKYEGYLSIPVQSDKYYGIIRYVGSLVSDYGAVYDDVHTPDKDNIDVGDTVVMDQNCNIPLEYPLHSTMEKDVLYRVQRRYILGKL